MNGRVYFDELILQLIQDLLPWVLEDLGTGIDMAQVL
jgi:hypothetical protein